MVFLKTSFFKKAKTKKRRRTSMKYKKQVAMALLCFTTQGHGNNVYSHTFFTAIPQHKLITNLTQNLLVDQAHENGRALKRRTVQIALFGGKSGKKQDLRDYFLYNGNNGLRMAETPTIQGQNGAGTMTVGNSQELIGSDFNIQTANGGQASTININPYQTASGAAISLRVPVLDRCWASLDVPVVHIKNNLNFTETFTSGPIAAPLGGGVGFINPLTGQTTTPVATMTQAFNQQGMLYGKISGAQSKTAIADMTLKLGYDFVDHTDFYLSGYAGFVFPTGNRPKAEYMFEAIVGNNHHFGINGGMYGQVSFENFGHNNLWLGWSMEGEYLFQNTQKRSFDLKGRPWSRYLQVFPTEGARQAELLTVPALTAGAITSPQRTWGINSFTQDVKVHAGYNGSFNFNVNYIGDAWHTALGLNTYVRQVENISLKTAWNNQSVQIAGLPIYNKAAYGTGGAALPNTAGATDPLRQQGILGQPSEQFFSATVPTYVQESDLDLGSAAHPAVYSQTVYSTIGYYRASDHYPQNFELGSSYEFGSCNTTLNRWTIWTKIQITF